MQTALHFTEADQARIARQRDVLRDFLLAAGEPDRHGHSFWFTLDELHKATGFPQASISAQLRHLRNGTGGYRGEKLMVEKRRRGGEGSGLWEYQVREGKCERVK